MLFFKDKADCGTEVADTKKRTRLYSLDMLKVIATVFIVFHHYQQLEGVEYKGFNFYGGSIKFGYMVELFFLLSGFFMFIYVDRIKNGLSFRDFFVPKYLRFLPLLAVSACVYQILTMYYRYLTTGSVEGELFSLWKTASSALGIYRGWVFQDSSYGVNNPTWYVDVLLVLYVYFFVATWIAGKLKVSPFWYYIFLSGLGSWIADNRMDLPYMTPSTGRGCRAFFFGLVIAEGLIIIRREIPILWRRILLLCAPIIIIWITYLMYIDSSFVRDGDNLILVYLYFPLIIFFFTDDIIIKRFGVIWEWLAKISFHVFIWHVCMMHAMNILLKKGILTFDHTKPSAMLLFTICIYVFGAISYYGIEKNWERVVLGGK